MPEILNSKVASKSDGYEQQEISSTTVAKLPDDWSEQTEDLLDSCPQVWTRGMLYLLFLIVSIALPWAMLFKVDEIGTARGRLEPQGKTFKLDSAVAGTVAAIPVKEGEIVKSGEPVLILDSKLVESELRQASEKLEGQLNRRRQLNALKNQVSVYLATQRQQNQAQELEKQAQIEQAEQNLKALKNFYEIQKKEKLTQANQAKAQAEIQQASLRLKEQKRSYQTLTYSGKLAILKSEEQLKNLEIEVSTIEAEMQESKSQIQSLELQLQQRILKSPIAGKVFQLPIQRPGAVVQPGTMLAEIAPVGSNLIVRAQMPTSESGSLRKGLSVKLKFDAYPFQNYGVIEGELLEISPTSTDKETPNGKLAVYNLEIALKENCVKNENKCIHLRSGDTTTAEVIVRQRRIIDFLLEPFKQLQQGG